MNNDIISLNIFPSVNRLYYCLLKKENDRLFILDIDSVQNQTESPIQKEIKSIIDNLAIHPKEINIILPSDKYILTQFPHAEDITGEDLKNIVDFEIKQHFGDLFPKNIRCILTPLDDLGTTREYVLLTLSGIEIQELIKTEFANDNINVNVIFEGNSVLNSLRYNYPEYSDKTCMTAGISDDYAEFSLLGPDGLLMMQYREISSNDLIVDLIRDEITKIETQSGKIIKSIFVFGEQLTISMLEQLKEKLPRYEIIRFNAFRKFTANIQGRKRQYCSRTMHIFPPVTGAALPDYTEQIVFL